MSNRELADKFRVYRDYTMICCGEFNDALATYILQNREAVLERNREIVFRNMAIAQEWIDSEPRVTWQAPRACQWPTSSGIFPWTTRSSASSC